MLLAENEKDYLMEFRRLTGSLGAEVLGLDLSAPLDPTDMAEVYAALCRFSVLLVRAPELTSEQHMAFGRAMGDIEVHAFFPNLGAGYEQVTVLDSNDGATASIWHTDETFLPHPPLGTITWAKEMPSYGGDTMWSSTTAAYRALSENMKSYLEGLSAVHDLAGLIAMKARFGLDTYEQYGEAIIAGRRTAHPVVRAHPVTGRKGLFVNPTYTTHIVGLPPDESDLILGFLYRHMIKEQFTWRHSWQVGDLAIWDNRSTMHRVIPDFTEHRLMHRVSIVGRPE